MPLSDEHWRRFGPLAAGALFGAAWWIWVDAVVCNSSTVPFLHYVPGTASPCCATSKVPPPPAALRPRYRLPLPHYVTAPLPPFLFWAPTLRDPGVPSFCPFHFCPPPSARLGFMAGIFATVAAMMFNAVHRDELHDYSPYDDGAGCRSRTWLFLAYVIAFASLAGAAGMLIKDASPPSTSSWPGAAGVFQCAFIIA
ncbi:unnamed protein product, partial [Closterium sp. Naga37s-1]